MSCCNNKECSCHQNSSFVFGIFIGLIIGAVIAIVIYKNNREKVFENLKKKLEKIFKSVLESETFQNISTLKRKVDINNSAKISKKIVKKSSSKNSALSKQKSMAKEVPSTSHKIAVTLPKELIQREFEVKAPPQKIKPRVFKK
ncbi:MAG TPA: hypothetical protein VN174_00420 [Candidatus Methanoperedens sp.]|nr:hypothetical protein [Candidatus Methanoperedens sp.]